MFAFFRSGPASNRRLARFHLATVVFACTARGRGSYRHKLAQVERATVETRLSRVRIPRLYQLHADLLEMQMRGFGPDEVTR